MLAAMNMYNVIFASILILGIGGVIVIMIMALNHDSQGEVLRPHLPRLIPWSVAAKLRRKNLELDILDVEARIADAKHLKLQKEMVYEQLMDVNLQRALESHNGEVENADQVLR